MEVPRHRDGDGPGHGRYETTILNGTLYFVADDGVTGAEFWRTDGTEGGTVLLKDIDPGPDASTPTGFTELNRSLFFLARSSPAAMGLWKTDGTDRGTVPVKAIKAGWPNSDLLWLTRAGRRLYFRHHDGDAGISSLWTSDETKAGTVPLTNRAGGPAYPSDLSAVGGALYFVAYDRPDSGLADLGLWRSDGTVKGTVLVKKFSVGTSMAVPFNLVAFDGNLFFQLDYFDGRPQPSELWNSDGTKAGTGPVKAVAFPAGPQFTAADGTLFFVADDGVTGTELWKTNGTAAGTRIVKDIEPGGEWYGPNAEWWFAYSSWPTGLTGMAGKLYFHAVANDFVTSLWRSDGTAKGTVKVLSLTTGPTSARRGASSPSAGPCSSATMTE